jgi:hypothetical protein
MQTPYKGLLLVTFNSEAYLTRYTPFRDLHLEKCQTQEFRLSQQTQTSRSE